MLKFYTRRLENNSHKQPKRTLLKSRASKLIVPPIQSSLNTSLLVPPLSKSSAQNRSPSNCCLTEQIDDRSDCKSVASRYSRDSLRSNKTSISKVTAIKPYDVL